MGKPPSDTAGRKQFLLLDDAPVLVHTIRKFVRAASIDEIWVAVRDEDREEFETWAERENAPKPIRSAPGGRNRQESVKNCLDQIAADVDLVAVHDAVRPFISPELIDKSVEQAAADGAVILGMPAIETVKQVDQRIVHATLPRDRIMLAQTPQVFRVSLLRQAYVKAEQDNFTGTDEASLVEHLGEDVHVMLGSPRNIKITRPEDFELARYYARLEREEAAETSS